jgi:CRISPR associated protein
LNQTIIHLDPSSKAAQRLIDHPYRIHYMLEDINPTRQRILWRFSQPRILVRHADPLDWKRLDQSHPGLGHRQHGKTETVKEVGSEFLFNVLAYARGQHSDQVLVPKRINEYADWIQAKSLTSGFETLEIEPVRMLKYYVRTSVQPFTLLPVELLGRLRVTNVEQFQTIYANGLGRMKGFGCGLLLLRYT